MTHAFIDKNIDADQVLDVIWQGGAAQQGPALYDAGFRILVLCAKEYQPSADKFPGLRVVHAPYNDTRKPDMDDLRMAAQASKIVARALKAREPILVTCQMGWNRSGLVSALAIHRVTGCSGKRARNLVQLARGPDALSNTTFANILDSLLPRRRGV